MIFQHLAYLLLLYYYYYYYYYYVIFAQDIPPIGEAKAQLIAAQSVYYGPMGDVTGQPKIEKDKWNLIIILTKLAGICNTIL